MHPVAGQIRRFWLYLLAWIPVAAMLAYVLITAGGLGRGAVAVLVPVLAILYALLCLAAWYPCRATPVRSAGVLRVLVTHGIAGALVSVVWVAVAWMATSAMASSSRWQGLDEQARRIFPVLFGIGVLLYVLAAALFYVILAMQKSEEAEQSEMRANILARDAELRALKAQINPHFLFNSLNSISALTTIDPQRAREMCISLAEFLRMTLGMSEKALIPMEEELALLNKFLSIEQIRFGNRLQVAQDVQADALHCMVLPLVLQPLLENAVNHGIAGLPEGGMVKLSVHMNGDGNSVHVDIENDVDPDGAPRKRSGVGLKNVRERLESHYGREATLSVVREETKFRVTLDFPAERVATV